MPSSLLKTAVMLLVSGCLLIATASAPVSLFAVVGYLCLGLALVSTVMWLREPRQTNRPVTLDDAAREDLRTTREQQGLVPAVRQLRQAHPQLGLLEAKQLVDKL